MALRRRTRWTLTAAALLLAATAVAIAPYRISQDSMEPTLHDGDIVLGWRPSVWGSPPPRWSELLFCHPRDDDRVVIKRLVGLPGETVALRDGDVHIDGRLAPKPAELQARLWIPAIREGPAEPLLAEHFEHCAAGEYQARFRVQDGAAGDPRAAGQHYVEDLRLTLTARAQAPGELWIDLVKRGHRVRWVFAFGREGGQLACGPDRRALAPLTLGRSLSLTAALWDGQAEARAGEEAVRLDLPLAEEGRDLGPAGPRIILVDGPIAIERLGLDRDIFYRPVPGATPDDAVAIPRDAFYALGDHSAASEDARRWGPVSLDRLIARACWSWPGGR